MAKILKIDEGIISIGMDDGSIKTVRMSDLNFNPQIGDEVELYQNEDTIICTKKEKLQENNNTGININLSNSQTVQEPLYVGNGFKVVNKTVYCLLAFFLGGIGFHKFYAGKVGEGILFILLCWTGVTVIIALVEFLVAAFKKADVNGNILV